MASGSFTTSTAAGAADYLPRNLTVTWSAEPDPVSNSSVLTYVIRAGYCSNGANYVTFSNVKVVINGVTVYSDTTQGQKQYNSNALIASGSLLIAHDPDGRKEAAVSAQAGIYAWAVNSTYTGTITLDPIARGLAHLDGGTYQVYVHSGTDWVLCAPYVGSGSGWALCN